MLQGSHREQPGKESNICPIPSKQPCYRKFCALTRIRGSRTGTPVSELTILSHAESKSLPESNDYYEVIEYDDPGETDSERNRDNALV